jgi:hypothetical protein
MNDKLQEIKTDLAVNGKQTKEKRLVMSKFSKETTYDEENFLCANVSLSLRIFSRSILSRSCF